MNWLEIYNWFFWILCVVSFILRKQSPFKQIWNVYKWIFIALFVVLFANYAKDKIKEWLN